MSETKKATCATCPWWKKPDGYGETTYIGACRNARGTEQPPTQAPGTTGHWWCSEHPDRKLQDVHELAARFYEMTWTDWDERRSEHSYDDRQAAAARDAYQHADALLAEAKRRRGE